MLYNTLAVLWIVFCFYVSLGRLPKLIKSMKADILPDDLPVQMLVVTILLYSGIAQLLFLLFPV